MASTVEICNRGLQHLGAARITNLNDASVSARAMNFAFNPVRLGELRRHTWNFAIKRVQLAASATPPAFGRANAFNLPSDFVRLLPPYPEQNLNNRDWIIENGQIITNDSAPLNIRYVADITDANAMDSLFREVLGAALAKATCEEITQSNTKAAKIEAAYDDFLSEARRTNAIEVAPQDPVEDTFITCRL